MKSNVTLLLTLAIGACATTPDVSGKKRLALYNAQAGEAVPSFRYAGRMNSWEALDDDVIAIWTGPREAWLLELSGPCTGLAFSPTIGLSTETGRVQAGSDSVLIDDPSSIDIPCRIRKIRPLDVSAILRAESQSTGTP